MNKRTLMFVLLVAMLAISSVVSTQAQSNDDSPDMILVNGNIATVDDDFSFVQALAIHGDTILASGSNEDVQSLAADSTQVIDLNGRTVLPGLINSSLLAIHADGMSAVPWSPFINLWYAVSMPGTSADGQPLTREEAVRVMTAIRSQLGEGDELLGSLQPGYVADLIVLSDDYFTVPVDDIRFITTHLIIIDGKIVYADGDYAGLEMAAMDEHDDHDHDAEVDHEHADAEDHDNDAVDDHEHDAEDHDAAAEDNHADHEHDDADTAGALIPNDGAVVRIISPADGASVSANDFVIEIETENFALGEDGNHWHVLIDGVEWGMIMGTNTSFALNGIEPGQHTVEVRLSNGMHEELAEGHAITVTVQ